MELDEDAGKERKILDDRLKQRWASKARRRSSEFKTFVGDKLNLKENQKLMMMMGKNGTSINSTRVVLV